MTNVGGQAGYPYGSPPPRSPSSWIWPALMGVGMVIAAVLALLVALQITDGGGDDSLGTADTTTSSSAPSTTTPPATTAPETTAPETTAAVESTTSEVVATTSAPVAATAAPTSVALPAPTAAPPPAPTAAPQPTPTPAPAPAPAPNRECSVYTPDETLPVRRCARGDLVRDIQNALRNAGFSIDADGFFGPGTETAVLEFQAREGLERDGIVGPDTYGALTG